MTQTKTFKKKQKEQKDSDQQWISLRSEIYSRQLQFISRLGSMCMHSYRDKQLVTNEEINREQ